MPNIRLGRGLDVLLPQKTQTQATMSSLMEVSLDAIQVSLHQARKDFNEKEIASLAESIKTYGLLEPILISEKPGEGFVLVAGERRWRAARLAGLKTISAIVRNVGKKEARLIGLIENIQRKDLNAIELAEALDSLAQELNLTHEEMAISLGFSRPRITNLLRLLELSDEIKDYVINGHLNESQARTLLSIEDDKERLLLARKIALDGQRISVRELESKRKPQRKDPNVQAAEENLSKALQTRVRVTNNKKRNSGWISIHYINLEHFENLYKRILGERPEVRNEG